MSVEPAHKYLIRSGAARHRASVVHASKPPPRPQARHQPRTSDSRTADLWPTGDPRMSADAASFELPRVPASPRVARRPAERLPLRPPALTDHLLQLIIVPVDGPRQGARVLGHDGSSSSRSSSNSLTSRLLAASLPAPNRRAAAAELPPTASGRATGRTEPGAGSRRGTAAAAHGPGGPRFRLLCVQHSGPAHGPASASAAPATEGSLGPSPSVPPSTEPHARAKLSLLPPPADTQRADVTAPVALRLGTTSGRHIKCVWINTSKHEAQRVEVDGGREEMPRGRVHKGQRKDKGESEVAQKGR